MQNFDFNTHDDEVIGLTQQRPMRRRMANNVDGRVNSRFLEPRQPETNPFIINNRTPGGMSSNGGQKKKRTSKHSKKYKNKTYYKNKNRKRQRYTRRVKKM